VGVAVSVGFGGDHLGGGPELQLSANQVADSFGQDVSVDLDRLGGYGTDLSEAVGDGGVHLRDAVSVAKIRELLAEQTHLLDLLVARTSSRSGILDLVLQATVQLLALVEPVRHHAHDVLGDKRFDGGGVLGLRGVAQLDLAVHHAFGNRQRDGVLVGLGGVGLDVGPDPEPLAEPRLGCFNDGSVL